MGGIGSGRAPYSTRQTVERSTALSLPSMLRNGQLEYPSVQYVSGFTLRIIPEEDGLQVHVQELGQQISLESTRLHFGHRWWFTCPRCSERRAHLYLARLEGGFYCRGCLKLDYESSRRNHAYDRVYEQIAAGLTAKGEPTAAAAVARIVSEARKQRPRWIRKRDRKPNRRRQMLADTITKLALYGKR